MKTEQWILHTAEERCDIKQVRNPSVLLVFGGHDCLRDGERLRKLREQFPDVPLVGCSTAGEIAGQHLVDALVVTAVEFRSTVVKTAFQEALTPVTSRAVGAVLMKALLEAQSNLRHVLLFSDGVRTNGTALLEGVRSVLPSGVTVSGGLAADGFRFENTCVLDGAQARQGGCCAIGLYGSSLRVGCGSVGGWDPFGPHRKITRSEGNTLYELDGTPALEIYRKYLGAEARSLPGSALLFPLSVWQPEQPQKRLVRTVLSVRDSDGSMTFAGAMPQGAITQMMAANLDRLIDGAENAARMSSVASGENASLALLVSCVGRRMVLNERTEEELEVVGGILPNALLAGFYANGEFAPSEGTNCELHNQTMTVTLLREE